MALLSNLFRGNRALEACALQDSAHITHGATGDHVAKIQFALFSLDGLTIDRTDLVFQQYGRSTAAAVLAYKKRRQIINQTYQSTPDDIVGKMTIAALDKEMRLRELIPKPPGDCVLTPTGAAGPLSFAPSTPNLSQRGLSLAGAKTANTLAPRQLGGVVQVFFQITLRAATENGYPLSANIERARDCLFDHGITLSVAIRNGFADTIQFSAPIIASEGEPVDNVDEIRKASEDVRPGLPGIFRVIVCQMAGDHAGDTFRNRVIGGRIVPPFALLNSQIIDRAHSTLIHEMIHASKGRIFPHDPEPASVFFATGSEKPGNVDRTFLKPEHALTLSTITSKL
ncbi:MAG: hypothetical protein ABI833_07565 [Acidobacteriota bacterium]